MVNLTQLANSDQFFFIFTIGNESKHNYYDFWTFGLVPHYILHIYLMSSTVDYQKKTTQGFHRPLQNQIFTSKDQSHVTITDIYGFVCAFFESKRHLSTCDKIVLIIIIKIKD